jgi:hypothetical protein
MREQEKVDRMRASGMKSRRNHPSVPYNPITLEYNASKEGAQLKFQDDSVKYRAAIRSQNLGSHSTCTNYNPITGEDRRAVPVLLNLLLISCSYSRPTFAETGSTTTARWYRHGEWSIWTLGVGRMSPCIFYYYCTLCTTTYSYCFVPSYSISCRSTATIH